MKNSVKSVLLSVALATCVTTLSAKTEKVKKEIVKCAYATDIDCEGCVKKVMNTIPYQKGIKSVNVDLPKKIITVEYDKSKSSNEAVISHFSKIDIKAKACDAKACDSGKSGCCK